MALFNFSQSGGELRIQDGGSSSDDLSSSENLETRSQVSIGVCFGVRKLPTGLEGPGSVSQTRLIWQLRINLYTCHSNVIQLYFKNPNSLQERPVSNLQTRSVCADKGRKCVMLDECYFLSRKYYH